jgi:hypothetical protein
VTKHVTEQLWVPEVRDDDVYLVAAEDRTVVVKLCRPDHPSSLLMAGYIAGLQAIKLREQAGKSSANPDLRTCPGCGRAYAMLYICERCGRCDARDLPRDADRRSPCCLGGKACVEIDWRGAGRGKETSP